MGDIPENHPRAQSLKIRHKLVEGMYNHIVTETGLIAHGRGEAFDYLLGEKTHDFSKKAIKAAAAHLFLSKHPVISVNGNSAILSKDEIISFSNKSKIPIEINLFYRSQERIDAISKLFLDSGALYLLGNDNNFNEVIDEISSQRRFVDKRGILISDIVMVPLEDGDRTEGLKKINKKVITIDLNPLSRTALAADVTIIDNIIRVFPILEIDYFSMTEKIANGIVHEYNNKITINEALKVISKFWQQNEKLYTLK